jgi:hypothetical protein
MQFGVEHDETLALVIELDADDVGVDLTKDKLGEICLEIGYTECLDAAYAETDPDGRPWKPLSPSYQTKRAEEGTLPGGIGFRTGNMLAVWRFQEGRLEIEPRYARWTYDQSNAEYAREFNKDRPFIGWTTTARERVEDLVRAASFATRPDEQPPDHFPPSELWDDGNPPR